MKAVTWAKKLDIQVMLGGVKTLKTLRESFPKAQVFMQNQRNRLNILWKKDFTEYLMPLLAISWVSEKIALCVRNQSKNAQVPNSNTNMNIPLT